MPARLRRRSGPVCDLITFLRRGQPHFKKKFGILMAVKVLDCVPCELVMR